MNSKEITVAMQLLAIQDPGAIKRTLSALSCFLFFIFIVLNSPFFPFFSSCILIPTAYNFLLVTVHTKITDKPLHTSTIL